jgi:16S rRNA (adenine1518-N6/adenine1519-N6)-dimethyltransferase
VGRRLGQHFLVRQSILDRIAGAVCEDGGTVIEIGPGRGALTAQLLTRAARVVAIEIDPVLAQYLRAKFRNEPKFELIENDVLKVALDGWGPAVIAGNLPYYITSPIIERALATGPLLRRAVFLVQKEVAERITARPGTREYGYLSVQTQLLAEAEVLFPVSRSAFQPPPKVESAVIRLMPRPQPEVSDPAGFLQFASLCFRQKRKTLRNNLAGAYGKDRVDVLAEAGMRAEQLSVAQLAAIFHRLRG